MNTDEMTPEVARFVEANDHLETLQAGSDEWKEGCATVARLAFEAAAAHPNSDIAKMMEQIGNVYGAFAEEKMPDFDNIRTLARDAQAFGALHDVESLSTGGEDLQKFLTGEE